MNESKNWYSLEEIKKVPDPSGTITAIDEPDLKKINEEGIIFLIELVQKNFVYISNISNETRQEILKATNNPGINQILPPFLIYLELFMKDLYDKYKLLINR